MYPAWVTLGDTEIYSMIQMNLTSRNLTSRTLKSRTPKFIKPFALINEVEIEKHITYSARLKVE